MPFAIILIAAGLIAAGVRGSYAQLGTLFVGDFTGSGSFLSWLAAIGIVGCIGYVPALEKPSRMFIALIMITMFLKKGSGFFDQFISAIESPTAGQATPNPATADAAAVAQQGGGVTNPSLPFSGMLPGMNNSFINGGGIIGGFINNGANATGAGTAGSLINGLSGIAGLGGG